MPTFDELDAAWQRHNSPDSDIRASTRVPTWEIPIVCGNCGSSVVYQADWAAVEAVVAFDLEIPERIDVARCPGCETGSEINVKWTKDGAIPMIMAIEDPGDGADEK